MFFKRICLSACLLFCFFCLAAQNYSVSYKEKDVKLKFCPKTAFGNQISTEWVGKNGKTLQAFNEILKLSVSNHFHKKFRILVDVNGYKDKKYYYLAKLARRCAHEVQKTKTTYTFDPMSPDERRVIHNAISGMPNVRSESTGEGTHRQVQIIYIG